MSFEFIFQKLIDYFPQITSYAVFAIILVFATYKFTKFYLETKQVIKDYPSNKKLLEELNNNFETLTILLAKDDIIKHDLFISLSPITTSELGEELYEKSGGKEFFEKYKDEFLDKLDDDQFDSPLEVQEDAIKVMIFNSRDAKFKDIQNFVYYNPVYNDNKISYIDILNILGLKLRDYYFKKNPDKFSDVNTNN